MPLAAHRSRISLALMIAVMAALLAFALAGPRGEAQAQGSPPPGAVVYSGTVTVGGSPAPDGLSIVARIDSPSVTVTPNYQSQPRVTKDGKYALLSVGPPNLFFNSRIITFHIITTSITITRFHFILIINRTINETLKKLPSRYTIHLPSMYTYHPSTLGPAYNEFGYYEHPSISSNFFVLLIEINV